MRIEGPKPQRMIMLQYLDVDVSKGINKAHSVVVVVALSHMTLLSPWEPESNMIDIIKLCF
jgi:hypothetical protein